MLLRVFSAPSAERGSIGGTSSVGSSIPRLPGADLAKIRSSFWLVCRVAFLIRFDKRSSHSQQNQSGFDKIVRTALANRSMSARDVVSVTHTSPHFVSSG